MINIGIRLAIVLERDPAESALLKVRAAMNAYAPTQTASQAFYRCL